MQKLNTERNVGLSTVGRFLFTSLSGQKQIDSFPRLRGRTTQNQEVGKVGRNIFSHLLMAVLDTFLLLYYDVFVVIPWSSDCAILNILSSLNYNRSGTSMG